MKKLIFVFSLSMVFNTSSLSWAKESRVNNRVINNAIGKVCLNMISSAFKCNLFLIFDLILRGLFVKDVMIE